MKNKMMSDTTFEVSACYGLQPVSLQQQNPQFGRVPEGSWTDAVNSVMGESQILDSSRESVGHKLQVVVVGKEVAHLGLTLQGSLIQLIALQLIMVQDEPAQIGSVG